MWGPVDVGAFISNSSMVPNGVFTWPDFLPKFDPINIGGIALSKGSYSQPTMSSSIKNLIWKDEIYGPMK